MLNHTYYAREILGKAVDLPEHVVRLAAKAQMIIAGVDGLSARELEDCFGLSRVFGATEDMIDELRKFDYKNAKLEDHLPGEIRPLSRQFLYFAIKIAFADHHYSNLEGESVRKAAKLLGIDEVTVRVIEGLVEAEHGLRAARMAILTPDS